MRDQKEPGEHRERTVVPGFQDWLELREMLGFQELMAYQEFQEREERQAFLVNQVPLDLMVPRDLLDLQGREAEMDPRAPKESQVLLESPENQDEMGILDFPDYRE